MCKLIYSISWFPSKQCGTGFGFNLGILSLVADWVNVVLNTIIIIIYKKKLLHLSKDINYDFNAFAKY